MKTINFPAQQEIEEQAALWISVIDRGITSAEQLELEAWLELSPAHGETLIKCASMWDLLDVLKPIAKLMPIDSKAKKAEQAGAAANESSWFASVAIAASVLLLLGVAVFMPQFQQPALDVASTNKPVTPAPTRRSLRYKTAVGELSSFTLADGSVIELNTDTELEVLFDETQRNIELVRGEVFFKVAKDASKPFVVNVGDDKVTAVGTAFSVNAEGLNEVALSVVEVIVTEGKVRFNSGRRQQPVYLSLGQKAVAIEDTLEVSSGSDSESLLAWRDGFVVFQGESLTEVIREVDRYTPLRFKLMDSELASISVGGYFKTGDLEQLLMVLENNFGVASQRVGNEILLSKSE